MSENYARVFLNIETSRIYGRGLLEGVSDYLQKNRPWRVRVEQHELSSRGTDWVKAWQADGVITRQMNEALAHAFEARGLKVVDLSDTGPPHSFARINSDDAQIGRLAANHLLQRGFTQFAFCGINRAQWSERRLGGYAEAIAEAGFLVSSFSLNWDQDFRDEEAATPHIAWLQSLPKPTAVFASNDALGQRLLEACLAYGIAVPEELAILGVDNDTLLCGLSNPTLTSVIPDTRRMGFEAGRLMDQLLAGVSPNVSELNIPPLGIAARGSTDMSPVTDSLVATALRFIRENACNGISVDDVARETGVGRGQLEYRFRKHRSHSPHTEIRNVQVQEIKRLLTTTDLKIERIAELTGFEHPEFLSAVFKRHTGSPPRAFGRKFRAATVATHTPGPETDWFS